MRVGVGKCEMCIPADFFPTEGFSGQHGALYARTVILGDNIDIVIISIEMTSLPEKEVDDLKRILSEETGIGETNCFVCVTHTFSAPHILPDHALTTDEARNKNAELKNVIHKAVRESARISKANITEVRLKNGRSECLININRDIETKTGRWISNCGTGPSDKSLNVILAENETGKPALILIHYAVQPSVLDGSGAGTGGRIVSGDLAGEACARLEERYPDAVVMFLLGAAGDQAPIKKAKTVFIDGTGDLAERDIGEEGLRICGELGTKLADSAIHAINSAIPTENIGIEITHEDFTVPTQKAPRSIHDLKPNRSYQYIADGEKQIRIEALRIGTIALLCVKPELNCITAQQIVRASPFDTTLVMTMVNGAAKYMADEDSYDCFTYEAMNSQFGKGAAEILSYRAVLLLSKLYAQK